MGAGFPLFLVGNSPDAWWQGFGEFCAWGFAIPGLVLSWYAALTYIPMAKGALSERRVGLAADEAR